MEMRHLETERRRGSPWESPFSGSEECGSMADWCAGWPSSDKHSESSRGTPWEIGW